jgi:hypothetical protein
VGQDAHQAGQQVLRQQVLQPDECAVGEGASHERA